MSPAGSQLRQIEPGVTAEELTAIAREDYDHLMHQELTAKVNEVVSFLMKMSKGDVVIATDDRQLRFMAASRTRRYLQGEICRSRLVRETACADP